MNTKTDMGWLMKQSFAPMRWAVPGVIPEGFGLLVGAPKLGKSWMALDIAISVAAGVPIMGVKAERKPVLYMALEDSWRRLQQRSWELLGNMTPPENLELHIDPVDALKVAQEFAAANPGGLMIVDTIALVKPQQGSNKNAYEQDYRFTRALKDMTPAKGTFIGVHHTRKQDANDYMDTISGSNGISGAADFGLFTDGV